MDTYLSVHLLGSESLDISNRSGSSVFEADSLESFVHVEGIVSGSDCHLLLFVFCTSHLRTNQLINNTNQTITFSVHEKHI